MNEFTLFVIGIIVFAMTVYGSVMAGGLLLVKQADADNAVPTPDVQAPSAGEPPAR